MALALDERPGSVCQPAHLVRRVSGEEFQLSADLGIADVFDRMDESMLILGAPGAGKTTQLLELATALVARTRASTEVAVVRQIPVIVDLAQWSRSGARRFAGFGSRDRGPVDFVRWLLRSIEDRYHVPAAVGRAWLDENRLIFLLDGLDEVPETDGARCVRAINELQDRHGVTRLAVCSRVADYRRFTERLRLQGAVEIRLLTREQVDGFLRSISPRLAGVAALLAADERLWELLTTPLMLNIMVIAEEERTATALAGGADATDRRRALFDAYVVEVLARRLTGDGRNPARTLRALQLLATASARPGTGVDVAPLGRWAAAAFRGSAADVMRLWLQPVVLFFSTAVPVAVMARGWSAWAASVVAAETIDLPFLVCIVLTGAIVGTGVLVLGVTRGALACWAVGVGHGMCLFAPMVMPEPRTERSGGTALARWSQRALVGCLALTVLVLPYVVGGRGSTPFWQALVAWGVGVAYGFLPAAFVGIPLARRYLRSALAIAGERNPWQRRFLRFTVDRSILTFDDGEYRFIHLLVRDHLAAFEPDTLADGVLRRRAELAVGTDSAPAPR